MLLIFYNIHLIIFNIIITSSLVNWTKIYPPIINNIILIITNLYPLNHSHNHNYHNCHYNHNYHNYHNNNNNHNCYNNHNNNNSNNKNNKKYSNKDKNISIKSSIIFNNRQIKKNMNKK